MRKFLLLFGALATMFMLGLPAQAHSGPTYYPYYYQPEGVQVSVHLVDKGDGYWTQNKRDRVADAIAAWNDAADNVKQPLLVFRGDWGSTLLCADMYHDISIVNVNLGSGLAGQTDPCHISPDELKAAKIKMGDPPYYGSSQDGWFGGNCGGNYGNNLYSFCGVVTHELGHALGQYLHFTDSPGACDAPTNTMCSGSFFTDAGSWTEYSLEGHDIHTYHNGYCRGNC